MVIQEPRLAFMEADRRFVALSGTGATQSEINAAATERRRARDGWIAHLCEPVIGIRLILREGVVVAEYAEDRIKASHLTSLNLSAAKKDSSMIAEEVWEMARPYPILESPDAGCEEAWKSAKRDALPKIEKAIARLLEEMRG